MKTVPGGTIAQAGGSVVGNARKDLEKRLVRPVITNSNAAQLNHVVTQMIEASASAACDDSAAEDPLQDNKQE